MITDSDKIFVRHEFISMEIWRAGGSGVSKNVNIIKQILGDKNCNKPRHAGDAQCGDLLPPVTLARGIFVFPL